MTRHHFEPTHVILSTGDYRYPIDANAVDIDAEMDAFARDLRLWFCDLQPGRYRVFFDVDLEGDDRRRLEGRDVAAPLPTADANDIRDALLELIDYIPAVGVCMFVMARAQPKAKSMA